MENHLKDNFVEYYQTTVRPLAEKCAKGFQTMLKAENNMLVLNNDTGLLKNILDGEADADILLTCKDPNAIWFIGHMIGDIDRALIKGIRLNTINSIGQIHGCLTSDSYWENVWENNFSSEEAKNLKELAEKMKELVTLL